jgi:endoglucanase
MIRRTVLWCAVLLLTCSAHAEPPVDRIAVLSRGVNITNWFRFAASTEPAALRSYLSDDAMSGLHRAGFTFVRLAVQPEFLSGDPVRLTLLLDAIARLQGQGLAVVIAPFPANWRLENSAADRGRLLEFWRMLAPALRQTSPGRVFPELLNEPVFQGDPAAWQALQLKTLAIVRAVLPQHTIVLTGNDWSSVAGLLALHPVADGNVVYAAHFYDPAELTTLAAYRPGLDTAALARLPFPAGDLPSCEAVARSVADVTTADLMGFYCSLHWDAARVDAPIAAGAAWGQAHGVRLLLTEFGASQQLNAAARLSWLAAVRVSCERHGMGWALWGYDDPMGFGVARPPPAQPELDRSLLSALGLAKQQ